MSKMNEEIRVYFFCYDAQKSKLSLQLCFILELPCFQIFLTNF